MAQTYFQNLDDEPDYERVEEFTGGMDAFNRPVLLGPNVSQLVQNMRVDDAGNAKTRPGADPLGGTVLATGEVVKSLLYYDTTTYERLYAAVDASLLSWDGSGWVAVGAYPYVANTIVEMCQGADLVYTSDGSSQWQSYSPGTGWSGALGNTAADPPVGATIMLWHTERMFAAGKASASDTLYVSDIALGAGTGGWVGAANQVRIGRGEGQPIMDMKTLSGFYMVVGKENSIYLANTDPTVLPENWQILRLTKGCGVASKHSMVPYIDRVFFMSQDGVRQVIPSAASDTPFEVSAPLSQPMAPYVKRINWEAKSTIRGFRYEELIMWAVPLDSAVYPDYVLVYNARTNAWSGYWTGWLPTCFEKTIFGGVERLVFGTSDGYVHQWKDFESEELAETYTDNGFDIASLVHSRSFIFGQPVNLKDPTWCEVQVADTQGIVAISVFLDGELSTTISYLLENDSNQLPMDLSFDLATTKPRSLPLSLDGLDEFKEAFVEVLCPAGKMIIKTITMGAFLNTRVDE